MVSYISYSCKRCFYSEFKNRLNDELLSGDYGYVVLLMRSIKVQTSMEIYVVS